MKISIAHVQLVANQLLDHIQRLGVSELSVDHDYYWNIPPERRYDPTSERLDADLGQLSDDWEWLDQIRTGDRPPTAPALDALAAILRAVGERVIG